MKDGHIFQCRGGFPIQSLSISEITHITVTRGSYSKYPWLSLLFGIAILTALMWYFSTIEYSSIDQRITSSQNIRSIGGLLVMTLFSGTIAVLSIYSTIKRVIKVEFQGTKLTFDAPITQVELNELLPLLDKNKIVIDQTVQQLLEGE